MNGWSFKNECGSKNVGYVIWGTVSTVAALSATFAAKHYYDKFKKSNAAAAELHSENERLKQEIGDKSLPSNTAEISCTQDSTPIESSAQREIPVIVKIPAAGEVSFKEEREPYIKDQYKVKPFVLKYLKKLELFVNYLVSQDYIDAEDAESFIYHFTAIKCSDKPIKSVKWKGREEFLFCIIHQFTEGLGSKYLRCYEPYDFFIIENSRFFKPNNEQGKQLNITNEKYPLGTEFANFFMDLYNDVKNNMNDKRANKAAAKGRSRAAKLRKERAEVLE